jgi:hypothetical protein
MVDAKSRIQHCTEAPAKIQVRLFICKLFYIKGGKRYEKDYH